ncbi:MAG: alanine--tRNA ligase [Clostridia bacterium]|nr:alanine--tRNA ligase [Clostridia bacterium]
MKWTGLNELREKYLSFYESKGHLRLSSFSLVPHNDNSLLLINSGMAPMKKYFTGEVTPPRKRVTTCQKCIRTPDIERVGKTARHGTYFEMLGNFSFGDYFKHEATAWAWEFCTKVIELPPERIWISIYESDDEAFDIWTKEVGFPAERIVRLGKEDNFWEHGSGPCGPCSELYFDRGEKYGCGSPDCGVGCECDRFVEFWNLVFTQFDNDGNNNYTPLDHPNIDTGMGLERLACIMQDVNNLFEVDTVQNIMKHISRIAGVNYGDDEKTDISLRVITDHIRSTTFMVGDGVMPSNEGRGYVLRRLLRRAARHGRLLGIKGEFLYKICDTVIEENKTAYPELVQKSEFIKTLIKKEEESFGKTIDQGLSLLSEMQKNIKDGVMSGEDAFRLYDTYGFPLDLTKDILEEQGITVNEDEFSELMKQQRERARAARKAADGESWASNDLQFDCAATEFVGYTEDKCDATILALICEGEATSQIKSGDDAVIVLSKTPFYATSGGQVGDKGIIRTDSGEFKVNDTVKNAEGVYMHKGTVVSGGFTVDANVSAEIDVAKRRATMRNHTAAHLLQNALRTVLGKHVEQAGQLVSDEHMRFDFTHFSALTEEELNKVSALVNENILAAIPVTTEEMPIEEAKKSGAMALFGEKYGDVVRVVTAGNSIEFCGGTHATNTAQLGLFYIVSEGSVASGVRRIEAVTGNGVLNVINTKNEYINKACAEVKAANADEMLIKIRQNAADLKAVQSELDAINASLAAKAAGSLEDNAIAVGSFKLITAEVSGADADTLRSMCDSFKSDIPDVVAVLCSSSNGKVTFCACCGKDAVKNGAHAGNIIRETAKICGGSGGGRPDSAMAGAKDASKINAALDNVKSLLENI